MPISSHNLKYFLNKTFVETGSSGLGLGISSALIAGFQNVYSVEINPKLYKECKLIFEKDSRVHLSLGNCGDWIESTLNLIGQPCTIYLDANGWEMSESPLITSLNAIIKTGEKNHLILIDDQNPELLTKENLTANLKQKIDTGWLKLIKEINQNYSIYLIDTHSEDLKTLYPAWVMVVDPIRDRFLNMTSSDFILRKE